MTGIAPVRVEFVGTSDPIIRELNRLNAGLGQTAQRVGTTDRAFNTFGVHAGGGLRKVENGIANLALGMVGLQGPIGKVTEGMILLGAGTGPLLLLAAAITAIGAAYRLLTKRTREQREEQDKLVKSYIETNKNAPDSGRLAAEVRAATLRAEVAHIEALNLDKLSQAILGLGGKKKELADIEKALGNDNAARAKKTRKQELDDALAAAKLQNDGLEALNKQAFAEDLVTRQQFFDQRITIARNATDAEVTALQGQLRDAHGEERKHLERMIALRKLEGDRQVLGIQFEQRLLEVEEERAKRVAFIAAHGGGNLTQGAGGPAAAVAGGLPAILQGADASGLALAHGEHITAVIDKQRAAAQRFSDAMEQDVGGALKSAILQSKNFGDAIRNFFGSLAQSLMSRLIDAGVGALFGKGLAFAEGGFVSGPGGPTSDSIAARLSNGEYVINAASTARNLPLLEAINAQPFRMGNYRLGHYAMGGLVSDPAGTTSSFAGHISLDRGLVMEIVNANFPVLVQNHRQTLRGTIRG